MRKSTQSLAVLASVSWCFCACSRVANAAKVLFVPAVFSHHEVKASSKLFQPIANYFTKIMRLDVLVFYQAELGRAFLKVAKPIGFFMAAVVAFNSQRDSAKGVFRNQ